MPSCCCSALPPSCGLRRFGAFACRLWLSQPSLYSPGPVGDVAAAGHRGIEAPSPILVDGKPQSIKAGKVFLFFYDPQCLHCDAAARFMSKFNWGDTTVIGIPTTQPQWAASFLHDTGLKAETSLDLAKLRKTFQFVDPPYGVALVNGREVASYGQAQFTPPAPKADLEKLGFAH